MQNQFFLPAEPLRPYIQQYIYIRADGSTDQMAPPEGDEHFVDGCHVEKLLPNVGMLLMVRGAEIRIDGEVHRDDTIFIIGPYTRTLDIITLHGWFEALTIVFKTGGMRAVLGYDLGAMKNKVCTTDLLGDCNLHDLGELIRKQSTPDICAPMLDAFFLARLNPVYTRYSHTISKVLEAVGKSRGCLSVADMASAACLSERQFRRIFSEYIGLSPKEFIRVWRFHQTLQHMQRVAHTGQNIDLLEVAARFGYYDVSHMAGEFRALGCTTPSQFQRLGIPIQEDFSFFFG